MAKFISLLQFKLVSCTFSDTVALVTEPLAFCSCVQHRAGSCSKPGCFSYWEESCL